MTYCRAWQRLDEGWMTVVVAVGPLAFVALLGGVSVMACRRRKKVVA